MSYLKADDPNLESDINLRKEFIQYKVPFPSRPLYNADLIPNFALESLLEKNTHLRVIPHSYQLFVKNFMNPNTPYERLFIGFDVGTGKTLAAIGIAMQFIN